MKTFIKLFAIVSLVTVLAGCSGSDATEEAKVNSDVKTGNPPASLEGSAQAGGTGEGTAATPSSSP